MKRGSSPSEMDSQNSLLDLPSDDAPMRVSTWLNSTFPTNVEERTERNYKCSKCRLRFTTPTSLDYHIQSVHTLKKRFSCDQCEKNFSHEIVLQYHKKTIHSELEHCNICKQTFLKSLNHKHTNDLILTHRCEVCKIYFTDRTDLTDHLLTHNSSLYKQKERSVQTEKLIDSSPSVNTGIGKNDQDNVNRVVVNSTSKSVVTVCKTGCQNSNECNRSRSGRILRARTCCGNFSFSPRSPRKRISSDINHRNNSLASVDDVPVSTDSGISSPNSR